MPSNLSGQFACISELIGYVAFKNNINIAPRQNILALVFFQMILQRVISVILLICVQVRAPWTASPLENISNYLHKIFQFQLEKAF